MLKFTYTIKTSFLALILIVLKGSAENRFSYLKRLQLETEPMFCVLGSIPKLSYNLEKTK